MQVHHIGIFTNDLERLKNFYVEHFGGKARDLYEDLSEPIRIYFIDFPNGAKLEIMSKPGCKDMSAETMKTGFIHLAFSFSKTLEAKGVKKIMDPTLLGDGSYESCFADPDGNLLEIVA